MIEELANIFKRTADLKYLCKKGQAQFNNAITQVLEEISLQNDKSITWKTMKGKYLSILNEKAI